jgi:putative ABC transport system substrate-binding protein
MRRREFIALIGGGAAWPLGARAQQPTMLLIGFVRSTSLSTVPHLVTAFRQGLKEAGFVEGQNVTIEYHSAEDDRDRLPVLVADLIRRQAAVLIGNLNAAQAAKSATITVPIVFVTGGDPVRYGLVASLNRPEGNVTGVVFFNAVLGAKRMDLLRQLVPKVTTIAMLVNPNSPETEAERTDVQAAAQAAGVKLIVLDANSDREFETAFATFAQRGAGALLIGTGPFMNSHREQLVALAAHHALPACHAEREAVVAGGLMSYGASATDAYRNAGIYAGRILKGEKPADLPVMRSTKFEFVLNLKTAKALGLTIPPGMHAIADDVVE